MSISQPHIMGRKDPRFLRLVGRGERLKEKGTEWEVREKKKIELKSKR